MPERDVVSWNTVISGFISRGLCDRAWEMFFQMRNNGVEPSEFTFSMLLSCVRRVECVKEMHGIMTRNGVGYHNLAVGNCLIDVYGKLGQVDYAITVFFVMERVDVISWNSLISSYCKSGYEEYALYTFLTMRNMGYKPDEYTMSSVLAACSNLRNLEKGNKFFCLCMKMGLLWSTIVMSACIDLFSKCNRLERATHVFEESCVVDSAISGSMIACYATHSQEEKVLKLFILTMKECIRPNEFALSSVISSAAASLPVEFNSEMYSLAIKSGFESDPIVASALSEVYCKYGLVDAALHIFGNMCSTDLIAWNIMILGLAYNGKAVESIFLFEELTKSGLCPDQITFAGVLLACSHGGFLEKGMAIFSSMEMQYGVKPSNEHHVYVVDMMSRAGKIVEAVEFLNTIRCEPSIAMWECIVLALKDCGDLKLTETVSKRILELDPLSSLPLLILADAYEQSGRWESLVRVRKEMKRARKKEIVSFSWISIRSKVYSFEANSMFHLDGKAIYTVLGSLMQEILYETTASSDL